MVVQKEFTTYEETVGQVLDTLGAAGVFAGLERILIKPNLVNASAYPVTTPVACVEALVMYIRKCATADIVIAEGCGAAEYDTGTVFEKLGYTELGKRLGIELIDLNTAPVTKLSNASCRVFPEFYMPEIVMNHYLISVPVLKAHSLADMTGSLKNMMGAAPPRYYQKGGYWKKSAFHARMHQAIRELNRYRTPDLTIMDATTGLAEYHLGGARCEPPLNIILGGFNPLEVDRAGAALLGLDWRRIPHMAD